MMGRTNNTNSNNNNTGGRRNVANRTRSSKMKNQKVAVDVSRHRTMKSGKNEVINLLDSDSEDDETATTTGTTVQRKQTTKSCISADKENASIKKSRNTNTQEDDQNNEEKKPPAKKKNTKLNNINNTNKNNTSINKEDDHDNAVVTVQVPPPPRNNMNDSHDANMDDDDNDKNTASVIATAAATATTKPNVMDEPGRLQRYNFLEDAQFYVYRWGGMVYHLQQMQRLHRVYIKRRRPLSPEQYFHRQRGLQQFLEWLVHIHQRNHVPTEEVICFIFQPLYQIKPNVSGEEGVDLAKRTTTLFKLLCEIVGAETALKYIERVFVHPDVADPSLRLEGIVEDIPAVKKVDVNKALFLASMKYNNNTKQDTVELDGMYTLFRKQQAMIHQCRAKFAKEAKEDITVTFEETIVDLFTISRKYWVNNPIDEEDNATLFRELCEQDNAIRFRNFCHGIGRTEIVMQLVEETIQRSSRSFDTKEALFLAGTKNNDPDYDTMVHLDCFYFLLRRQPNVLDRLRSPPSSSLVVAESAGNVSMG